MKLNRTWAMVAAIVMALTLSLSGTLAYLSDTDEDVNVMTLGNVYIEQHEYERDVNADGTYKTDTIDSMTSYVLKDFTQGKPLYPAVIPNGGTVNGVTWAYDSTRVRMTQVDSYGTADVFNTPNAVDKFVTVENTGKSDAYVRTLIAFEQGTLSVEEFGKVISSEIRANDKGDGSQPWTYGFAGSIEVDGNNYYLYELIYSGAKLSTGDFRHENGVLPAGDTTYPNLCQVYMTAESGNEEVEAIDGNKNGTYDILVVSQAVQAAGFDNAKLALDTAFGPISASSHPWVNLNGTEEGDQDPDDFTWPILGGDAEGLQDALTNGGSVALQGDVTASSFEVDADTVVTLDLADNTISTENGLVNNGTAVIENGTLESSATGYGARTTIGGNSTFNNLDVVTSGGGVNVWGTAVWNEGSVTTNSTSTSARHVFYVAGAEGAEGHLTINCGEFTFSPDNLTRKGSYLCAHGADATIIVNGGTFHQGSTRTAPIQEIDGGTVTIYGGSFAFDPSAFVADGYEAVKGDNGYWTVSKAE